MENITQRKSRFHQRAGFALTVLLMLPIVVYVVFVMWRPIVSVFSGKIPIYVFRGEIFRTKFNIVHAGTAMDQPTIGKYLIWFTFFMIVTMSYTSFVRWLINRKKRLIYWTYNILLAALCAVLLCILAWPVCMLIEYVNSMGVTAMRIAGFIYSAFCLFVLVGFFLWSVQKPEEQKAKD